MWLFSSVALAADVPWQRPINDAFDHDAHVWIGPFPERLEALARKFGGTVQSGAGPLPDDGVPYVYGDPSSNGVLGDVLAWHGITLDAEGVTFGETRVAAADPFLIVALPRPDRLTEPVVVYTAWSEKAQPELNRVFHGPTAVVVGHIVDGAPKTLYAGGFDLDSNGRVRGLSIGPARLTPAQAVEDLHALRDQLVSSYAGLADIDADLRASGSSWTARVAATEQTFATRESWAWTEVWDALITLLEPVEDSHFTLRGSAIGTDGALVSGSARLTTTQRVWFADGRLTGGDDGWLFEGTRVSEVPPPVPGPAEVEAGTPYRFPTRLSDGSPAWLVGEFALDGVSPEPLRVGDRVLTLHAARVTRQGNAAPWALEPGEIPVLSVSTMMNDRLAGLLETPRQLRTHDRVILDLRGNGGGADTLAQQWVSAFAPQVYRWHGGADLSVGPGAQADRLQAWNPSTFGHRALRSRWKGELTVLVDGNVASSGETFTMLASQIPDAVRMGTNTLGCTRFGNVSEHAPLPNTRISATFGHTQFDFADVIPVAEGRGIFPDLWLDEPDPVAFVRALPATR